MTLPDILDQLATVVPAELLEDAAVTDDNFNNLVKSVKLIGEALAELKDNWGCPPIGGKYVRLPGVTLGSEVVQTDPLPQDKWPGTAWRHISSFYANKYFRVVGDRTVAFEGGPQGWMLVDHGHNVAHNSRAGSGNVSYGKGETRKAPNTDASISVNGPRQTSVALTVGDELRVENYAIEIYERVPLP